MQGASRAKQGHRQEAMDIPHPHAQAPIDLEAKLAFLGRPDAYPEATSRVDAVETHMSWVFLTTRHAYKLKKPGRMNGCDLRTAAARERHGLRELRLNRRFAADVYLGLSRLARAPSGRLALDGAGETVDWLVRMRRLPERLMLDRLIAAGRVDPERLGDAVRMLARIYAMEPPRRMAAGAYCARIAARIEASARRLRAFPAAVDLELAAAIARRQLATLRRHAALFEARARAGRLVEGHGDLRPEHVCLAAQPCVIDCLDFSRALRIVDPAEELGFLALECERLGAPWIEDAIFDAYARLSRDRPPRTLVRLHQSVHAVVRAGLAVSHLRDPAPRDPQRWPRVAADYLRLADARLARGRARDPAAG